MLFCQLADALVEHETLTEEEVYRVIRGEKLPKITDIVREELDSQLKPGDAVVPTPTPHASPPTADIATTTTTGSTSPSS